MPVHDLTRLVALSEFHDFHLGMVSTLRDSLNQRLLPSSYYAAAEGRIMGFEPDVSAFEVSRPAPRRVSESEGGLDVEREVLQTSQVAPRTRYIDETDHWSALRESRVVIHSKRGDRVVAVIEVVSPRNKDRAEAVTFFGNKLETALQAGCNGLVIDLLPAGKFDPLGMHQAFWSRFCENPHGVSEGEPLAMSSYHAPLQNGTLDPIAYFESVAVGQELPEMPLFLSSGEYINMPMQRLYDDTIAKLPSPYLEDLEDRHAGA